MPNQTLYQGLTARATSHATVDTDPHAFITHTKICKIKEHQGATREGGNYRGGEIYFLKSSPDSSVGV